MGAASFFAIRCLFELANEISQTSPRVSKRIEDFYGDDLLSCSDTMEENALICEQRFKVGWI